MSKITRNILKIFFMIFGLAIGVGLVKLVSIMAPGFLPTKKVWLDYLIYFSFGIIFAIIFNLLYSSAEKKFINLINLIDSEVKKLETVDFVLGSVGLLVGLLISALFGNLTAKIPIPLLSLITTIVIYVVIISISVTIFIRRKDDFRSFFKMLKDRRKELNTKSVEVNSDSNVKIVDTSVIIDGRIADILKTGFIEGNLIVPSFVLEELQYIADSADASKRQRGRRGLDILNDMRKDYPSIVEVMDFKLEENVPVDTMLLNVAQEFGGSVITNDYNLNKVAGVKGVRVLNINDLAKAVKPVVLPGEILSVCLTGIGSEPGQGVAYLNDGTMVVVENGADLVGQTLEVVVQSVLQTSAGRLIFAR
ncbi:MAG: PIN domain nuclease [Ezakiella sp.]|nr:PIN domain nuclease [Ezakiella sp.]MDD7471595.1 PIN domain nuclease [Bacillota bacterium]MDY3923628.1 PIN domain nuclease [Ezakiella sp.]